MLPILEKKVDQLAAIKQEFLAILEAATAAQRNFQPDENSWNMLQVAQHLMKAEVGIVQFMQKRTPIPASFTAKVQAAARSKVLTTVLRSSKKIKAPKVAGISELTTIPYKQIVHDWAVQREALWQFLAAFPPTQKDYLVFKHPLAGKLNIVQTIDFMTEHIRHHLGQLQRIRQDSNFPSVNERLV